MSAPLEEEELSVLLLLRALLLLLLLSLLVGASNLTVIGFGSCCTRLGITCSMPVSALL